MTSTSVLLAAHFDLRLINSYRMDSFVTFCWQGLDCQWLLETSFSQLSPDYEIKQNLLKTRSGHRIVIKETAYQRQNVGLWLFLSDQFHDGDDSVGNHFRRVTVVVGAHQKNHNLNVHKNTGESSQWWLNLKHRNRVKRTSREESITKVSWEVASDMTYIPKF